MAEPFAFLNGQFLPAGDMRIHVGDVGFVQGAAVAEQLRTFNGVLFRLEQHLDRLARSLEIVGIDPGMTPKQLAAIARRLASENRALLSPGDDLALTLFVTPGLYPNYDPEGLSGPTVGMHTTPLPFRLWVDLYQTGQKLAITDITHVPASCWPPELKCRSRMHYFLADRQARQKEPGARALLLDQAGRVTEASTANLVLYRRDEGLLSPPKEMILPGVSMSVVETLAAEQGLPFGYRELLPQDVLAADEVMLASTSPCILPATSLDGKPLGTGQPGPVFRQLLEAWGRKVGLDIVAQARRFAAR